MDCMSLGEEIRQRRKKLHMTQAVLGKYSNLSTAFIGHIERGTRKLSVESLIRISVALKYSIDDLLFNSIINAQSKFHELKMVDFENKENLNKGR